MTQGLSPNGTGDFLVKLRKIDMRGLTCRDILVLYTIMKNPGCSGMDVTHKLGLIDRSSIASNINRLIRHGYIDDRREVARKANPGVLHILQPGLDLWDEVKP